VIDRPHWEWKNPKAS